MTSSEVRQKWWAKLKYGERAPREPHKNKERKREREREREREHELHMLAPSNYG